MNPNKTKYCISLTRKSKLGFTIKFPNNMWTMVMARLKIKKTKINRPSFATLLSRKMYWSSFLDFGKTTQTRMDRTNKKSCARNPPKRGEKNTASRSSPISVFCKVLFFILTSSILFRISPGKNFSGKHKDVWIIQGF